MGKTRSLLVLFGSARAAHRCEDSLVARRAALGAVARCSMFFALLAGGWALPVTTSAAKGGGGGGGGGGSGGGGSGGGGSGGGGSGGGGSGGGGSGGGGSGGG